MGFKLSSKKWMGSWLISVLLMTLIPAMAVAADTPAPASTGNWANLRTYLCNYATDSQILSNMSKFTSTDMDILAQETSAATLSSLKTSKPSLFEIAYLSIGETKTLLKDANGQIIKSYYHLDDKGNPIQNAVWGGYYTDPGSASWQDYVVNTLLPQIYSKGFDGVFLDTVDDAYYVDAAKGIDFRDSEPGMYALIQKIKTYNTGKKVIVNRGYNLFGGIAFGVRYDVSPFVDGDMMESVNSTWASDYPNPDGTYNTNYHEYPAGSQQKIYSRYAINKFNQIRFQYNADGTVKKDGSNAPVKSNTYFHVFALDYVYNPADLSLSPPTTLMQANVNYEWPLGVIPSAGRPDLNNPPYYDWPTQVILPSSTNWASNLDIPSMPVVNPYAQGIIDNFASGVSKWQAIAGSSQPGVSGDTATVSQDTYGGVISAKLSMTVQGTKAWQNYSSLQSVDWFTPADLSEGYLTFQAKLSTAVDTTKRVQIQIQDSYKDYKVFDITNLVTTGWTTIRLDLNNDGAYYPGWDGLDDGFHPESVKNILFQVVNNLDGASAYTGSLYISNLQSNEDSMPYPDDTTNGFVDNFSVTKWTTAKTGSANNTAALTADTTTFPGKTTGKFAVSIVGTTAWTDGVTLKSTDWFDPVDFTNRSIYFDGAVSPALTGTNKSFLFQLTDVNNNTKTWDLTAQLNAASLTTLKIDPLIGGSIDNQNGSTFQLNKIKSLKWIGLNTVSGSGTYTGSIWLTNLKAPQVLPAPDSTTGLIEDFTKSSKNWKCSKTGSTSNGCRFSIDSTSFAGLKTGRVAVTVVGNTATTDAVTLKSVNWYTAVDFTKRVLKLDAKISTPLTGTNKSVLVQLVDASGNTKSWDITTKLSTTNLSTVTLNMYDPAATTTGSFQINAVKSMRIMFKNNVSNSTSYTGTLWFTNVMAPVSMPYPDATTGIVDDFSEGAIFWTPSILGSPSNTAVFAADSTTFAGKKTGKLTMHIAGTTAWADGAVLKSADWSSPIDFSTHHLYLDAAVSPAIAGTNKSVQLQITDKSGNYTAWDITSQLGASLNTINIDPLVGGTVYIVSGTFQISQIQSIKIVVLTNTSTTPYVDGALWLSNVKIL